MSCGTSINFFQTTTRTIGTQTKCTIITGICLKTWILLMKRTAFHVVWYQTFGKCTHNFEILYQRAASIPLKMHRQAAGTKSASSPLLISSPHQSWMVTCLNAIPTKAKRWLCAKCVCAETFWNHHNPRHPSIVLYNNWL